MLIVETNSGWVCANAGIDASNVPTRAVVALLPADPDASARRIRAELDAAAGVAPGGRRRRQLRPALARRPGATSRSAAPGSWPSTTGAGAPTPDGRELTATVIAVADQLAAAADLARDKTSGAPAALVRGAAPLAHRRRRARRRGALQRAAELDLFR